MCDNENILINTLHKLPQAVALLAYTRKAPSSNLGPVTIITQDSWRFLLNAMGAQISHDHFKFTEHYPSYHSTLYNLHSRYSIVK
jgi:hypothetical protein